MRRLSMVWTLVAVLILAMGYLLTPATSTAYAASTTDVEQPVPLAQMPVFSIDNSIVQSRIVGGTVTRANEFPWQVYLVIEGSWTCGASVIKSQYILTAAHCVTDDFGDPVAASSIQAYMGLHDKRYVTARTQSRTGARLYVHSSYNADTYDYDIAVVKLNAPLTLNTYVKTIRLAKSGETALYNAGRDVTVSGWGTTSSGGSTSNYLRKVTVDIVSKSTCNAVGSYAGSITNRMICASRAGKDSCQGDSGGPLFLQSGGMYKQVGVVSWGNECALARYPGVYSHVGVLRNWVAARVPSLP